MAKTDLDLPRLCQAIQTSRQKLNHYRTERRALLRQYAGPHWLEGEKPKDYVNLLALYGNTVGRTLVAKNPRFMASVFNRGLKPTVNIMEEWGNGEIEKMKMADILGRVVLDALSGFIGITKVALATPSDSATTSWHAQAGQVMASRVDLDDWVFDMNARDPEEVGYSGHRYRVPLDTIRDSKLYHKNRKSLKATTNKAHNEDGEEKTSTLGAGSDTWNEEWEEFIDLWEIYLPRHRAVITLVDDDGGGASLLEGVALREQDWIGPYCGPYHLLGYGVIPGNVMSKSPMFDIVDLHILTNNLFRKLARQSERQKTVLPTRGASSEDMERLAGTDDGFAFKCDNAEHLKELPFGGPNPQNMAMFLASRDLFSWAAGNLEMMAGLSPQSKTATQDKMLNENSTRLLADLQDRTINYTAEVIKALCWYWWHDPEKTMRATHSIPGLPEFSIERKATPQMRQKGRYEDLDIRIDPYSMQHQTPQSRLAALNQVVMQIVVPLMPVMQQQGIAFDMNSYLQKVSKYMDMPDLAEIVTMQEPVQVESTSDKPKMPGQTEREYTRHNVSEKTRQGQDASFINNMMTGKEQGGAQKNGSFAGV